MSEFQITGEYIQLIQLLKAAGLVENGGEAQALVMANKVKVNGQLETRKRAKIRPGDKVETPFGSVEVK
jgi:ribosome-associated protein